MFDFDFEELAVEASAVAVPEDSFAAELVDQELAVEASAVAVPEAAQEPLLGSWAYLGRLGRTVYRVRASGSGHLIFEGPDADGECLTGVLKPREDSFAAELVDHNGMAVGHIQLHMTQGSSAVVSSFRAKGSQHWGREITAHRALHHEVPVRGGPTKNLAWEDGAFTVHCGFLRAGGDILVEEVATLAEAKEHCGQLPGCRGFCFKGALEREAKLKVYYKDTWDLVRGTPSGGWTSYRYEAAPVRLSDLPGSDVDEDFIAEVASSEFDSVYVFKSPLATFPEWKKDLKVHQIVILWHEQAAGLQLEYFVGGVHFQRKPYPWVHRGGAELVEQVEVPHLSGMTTRSVGAGVAQVLRKWLLHGRNAGDKPSGKDCILFAMELVECMGAMSSGLMAHFQSVLAWQFNGW